MYNKKTPSRDRQFLGSDPIKKSYTLKRNCVFYKFLVDCKKRQKNMVPPRQYSKRANIDCSILVNEIEARPELWDLKNPSRHNRVSLSENWNAIGSALNESGEKDSGYLRFFFVNKRCNFSGNLSEKVEVSERPIQERI